MLATVTPLNCEALFIVAVPLVNNDLRVTCCPRPLVILEEPEVIERNEVGRGITIIVTLEITEYPALLITFNVYVVVEVGLII